MNFPSTRPTLAEINVSKGISDNGALMLLNLLMHLALHLRHKTLIGSSLALQHGNHLGKGRTRSTNLIVNTSLSLGLALKKPPGKRPAAANFSR
jgi:hypothetical protein